MKQNTKQGEERVWLRHMLQIGDYVINIHAIETIQRRTRYVHSSNNPHWEYGIGINTTLPPSEKFPRPVIDWWCESEAGREEMLGRLLKVMTDNRVEITKL